MLLGCPPHSSERVHTSVMEKETICGQRETGSPCAKQCWECLISSHRVTFCPCILQRVYMEGHIIGLQGTHTVVNIIPFFFTVDYYRSWH